MARALRPAHSCPPVRKEVGWAAARALRPARARPLSFETPQRPVAHERGRVWDDGDYGGVYDSGPPPEGTLAWAGLVSCGV